MTLREELERDKLEIQVPAQTCSMELARQHLPDDLAAELVEVLQEPGFSHASVARILNRHLEGALPDTGRGKGRISSRGVARHRAGDCECDW